MNDFVPAEAFPPGDFVREELEARGWTQSDLAEILGRPLRTVNEVVSGRRAVTPETARGLAEAFGTSAQYWMNLESAYQLYRAAKEHGTGNAVSRRAKLYSVAPIKDMLKRGWIEGSDNIDVLESRVCSFFGLASIDDAMPQIAHAARKTEYGEVTSAQAAWLLRARQIAQGVGAAAFSRASLDELVTQLGTLLWSAEEIRRAPKLLADHGVRLVVVEQLPHTKIDGVCFWLDENSPVIALSLRYDRIDSIWFTLMHELGHVAARDGLRKIPSLDIDLLSTRAGDTVPPEEAKANQFAAGNLIPQDELDGFIARVAPLYSKHRIRLFAQRLQVHPGLVIGQLQYRSEIDWSHSRDMLDKARHFLIDAALTDGFGHQASIA